MMIGTEVFRVFWAEPPEAEKLLALARRLKMLGRRGTTLCGSLSFAETCALALTFDRLPAATKFRALFEDWDRERIIREVW
ncbi:MAG TPA: hypothetical protein VKS79_21100 [Gemmataceae bacterium]|nr:hypothetical protein [Gemmataceae bacterium]